MAVYPRDPYKKSVSTFFINYKDHSSLDYQDGQPRNTVFENVIEGQDTIEQLATVERNDPNPQFGFRNPKVPVIIQSVKLLKK